MSDVLWFNGKWTTTDQPVLPVEDRGLQFGDAIYEVIKFLGGTPAFAREHYDRMERGLGMLAIRHGWTWESFRALLRELMDRTSFDDGIIYVQVTRGVTQRKHDAEPEEPVKIVYSRSFKFPDEAKRRNGVAVITRPDLRWGRCDLKTTNLLPNTLGKKEAIAAGADEAIFIDDGFVTEGSISNFFAVEGEAVITHPTDEKILPGVVRDRTISVALRERIRVDERPILENELFSLDEAFITSTTAGVMPVVSIDGRRVGEGFCGPVTQRLQNDFLELERSQTL